MSDQDKIREDAYARWEAEGRPEGQHERHWTEASNAHERSTGTPRTWSADHGGGVGPDSSEPDQNEGVRPADLNTENDQGAG
jgi:hypothetical protein